MPEQIDFSMSLSQGLSCFDKRGRFFTFNFQPLFIFNMRYSFFSLLLYFVLGKVSAQKVELVKDFNESAAY